MGIENGTRAGFDANERARRRESGPILIGAATYHATRLTNRRSRDVRRLSREAGKVARGLARESEEYREAYDEAIREGLEEKEARAAAERAGMSVDAVVDYNMDSLVQQLRVLLVDDSMQAPSEEVLRRHLDEDLDTRDIEGLLTYLMGDDEEDPTPKTPSAAT